MIVSYLPDDRHVGPPLNRRWETWADLLALHRYRPERYPYLLESVASGTASARYDVLFAFPGASLAVATAGDFLPRLDAWWRRDFRPEEPSLPLPFQGGWFVYLGYELASEIEPRLQLPQDPSGLPLAFATRIPAAVILDHQRQETWLVAEAEEMLMAMARDLKEAPAGGLFPIPSTTMDEEVPTRFLTGVARVKDYILAGDVFQVNLSRAWQGTLPVGTDYLAAYNALRLSNPAPFSALVRWGNNAIVSSSPERLVRVSADVIETRPIAGTRPRGLEHDSDHIYSQDLLAHPKERAEHIMLIDLERNDLGRVCWPGSVSVDEFMTLESYAHVHHIVSNVRGRIRPGTSPGQILGAVFPGGTITGCPKVRCMEIIAELEQVARGPYTGALGYLNHNGDMDFNILIRTLWTTGRRLTLRAGAGIVADSEPEAELEETRAKARGLLLALGSISG